MSKFKVVKKDNGYFEIVARPCGHEVRVTTEHFQWGITEATRKVNRERVLRRSQCGQCS